MFPSLAKARSEMAPGDLFSSTELGWKGPQSRSMWIQRSKFYKFYINLPGENLTNYLLGNGTITATISEGITELYVFLINDINKQHIILFNVHVFREQVKRLE